MKVLARIENPNTGMYYHRIVSPFARMNTTHPIEVTETNADLKTVSPDALKEFQAVFYSRIIEGDTNTTATIQYLKAQGKKIIFDIDDYWQPESTHRLAKAYRDEKIPEKTIESIRASDLVFVPTPYMADVIRPHNKNVHIIKTAIDMRHPQWSSPSISSSLLRFGWIGGTHHLQDVKILERSITKVHQSCTEYQLVLGGFDYIPPREVIIRGEVRHIVQSEEYLEMEKVFTSNYKFTDQDYNNFLQTYDRTLPDHISYYKNYRRVYARDIWNYGNIYNEIDISLVPLRSSGLFNQYKSELKLIEAGVKGKMAIVSKVRPYTLIPKDKVHFIDSGDLNGWHKAIKYCLENREYVKEKAQALSEYIKENYNLDRENGLRYELIKEVCTK